MRESILIAATEMHTTFRSILLKEGFAPQKAEALAEVFTTNSVDGVYTHGVNRFPVFVQYVKEGFVDTAAEPGLQAAFNGLEQWNGNLGPGPLNAMACTERAMQLARQHGLGCVALANTNHWMRGGYYGWQAAKEGFVFIGWTNTTALMPAWGAVDSRLGNNPLVMALPFGDEAVVLDAAMSQFSYGALEMAAAKGEKLPVNGGYDANGLLTNDPAAILQTRRSLPIGYWKGAGLSLLLDMLATVLSGGQATHQISSFKREHAVSQVFVCIDLHKLTTSSLLHQTVSGILDDYQRSEKSTDETGVAYPGERVLQTRRKNRLHGVPVLQSKWQEVLNLCG